MPGGTRRLSFSPLTEGGVQTHSNRDTVPTSIIIDNTCRVYITQIPLERIESDGANAMRAEFEAFGPVESYKMFTERSGRFIGSVLCTYRNPADASAAVQNMNGLQVESSVLKVSLSRDHGVILLHPAAARHRREKDDERWQHDQYDPAAQEGDFQHAHTRGGRGGRRGRGGRGRRIDEAFERYIASRDNEKVEGSGVIGGGTGDGNSHGNVDGGETAATPATVGESQGNESDRKQ